jgi:exosortase D (VPLPA-CTERM-specific)
MDQKGSLHTVWVVGPRGWLSFAISAALLAFLYWNGARELLHIWGYREEYSYAYFIPFISLFIGWQKKNQLARAQFDGAWLGVLVLAVGVSILLLGSLSAIFLLVHYSLIIVLFGLILSYTGWRPLRALWPALVYLVFMIPFPVFLNNQLSLGLQLISSEIGVAVIRLFGISVFLEGNVIDLGIYKLQVVDACSGLRYLFPLMSFGFLLAYLYKGPAWQRVFIFLSTIPITVFMNSFRIGMIGVLVEHFGIDMAEGFLHDFEGWVIFMACTAILMLEIWLFWRFSKQRMSFWDSFAIEFPEPLPASVPRVVRPIPKPLIVSIGVLLLAAIGISALESRPAEIPERAPLAVFPDRIGTWTGRSMPLASGILEELGTEDYFIADYLTDSDRPVNFYAAFYESQQAGDSAHSPRSCIPGGGWKIADMRPRVLDDVLFEGQPLRVNRLEIVRGKERMLVYYWFEQRGRNLTNEYAVKWFLFWDALTRNRTDGAILRLTTMVLPDEDWDAGDARLTAFARELNPAMTPFRPSENPLRSALGDGTQGDE